MLAGMGGWVTTPAVNEYGNKLILWSHDSLHGKRLLTFQVEEFAYDSANLPAVYPVWEFLVTWDDGQTMGKIRLFCPALDPWSSYRHINGRLCGCNWARRC